MVSDNAMRSAPNQTGRSGKREDVSIEQEQQPEDSLDRDEGQMSFTAEQTRGGST